MTECIKNHQTKNHFTHDQKHTKKKRSTENNLSRNGSTVTSNNTFKMLDIHINKISKDLLQKPVVRRCSVKKVLLKISQISNFSCKIDLKINFKINLKINSSTVVFSCESCGIFKNTYFVEHRQTAASATDINAKYSHPSQ